MRTDGRGAGNSMAVEDLFECRACNRSLERTATDSLRCPCCGWTVRRTDGYWDFLAERCCLPAFEWRLRDVYREICAGSGPAEAWGAQAGRHRGVARLRKEQTDAVLRFAGPGRGVIVDVSAGSGWQLARCAPAFRAAIHWEAHVPSVRHARMLHQGCQASNIRVCRGSYLELALRRQAADVVLCFDTVERGVEHDTWLLREIARVLKPGGRAMVDYHYRGKANHSIRCYSDVEFREMAVSAGLALLHCAGAGYGPTAAYRAFPLWWACYALARLAGRPARRLAVLTPQGVEAYHSDGISPGSSQVPCPISHKSRHGQ